MSTVLVLDDRPDDRELMATLLRYAGHAVLESPTGEEALELAHSAHPDLVISDILMPGMNGYEFVRRLREDTDVGATPVIFCTANYLEGEVRELAAACGVSRFISKPCPPELVLATVSEALDEPQPALPMRPVRPEFEREQLRVINDKLVEKVAELERVSTHRRELLGLVMGAQEQERRRIADGIHDDSLQAVVAVGLQLGVLRTKVETPQAETAVRHLKQTIRLAAQRLRSLLFELRPQELDSLGLIAALRAYLEHVEALEGLAFEIDAQLTAEPEPELRAFLYRVTQEILMNVRKHAQATRVAVTVTATEDGIAIAVRDDGIGFDVRQALTRAPAIWGSPR